MKTTFDPLAQMYPSQRFPSSFACVKRRPVLRLVACEFLRNPHTADLFVPRNSNIQEIIIMMQSRTHNCGELRIENAGQQVTLVGWLENNRQVSASLSFIVLRDFYGTTQIVAETEEMAKEFKAINKESTIQVTGVVRERSSKNPKQATGEIEVVPEKVTVLGRCRYNELPFEINRSREGDEQFRLKYRYLDLRNPEVKNNIILRCQVVAAFC